MNVPSFFFGEVMIYLMVFVVVLLFHRGEKEVGYHALTAFVVAFVFIEIIKWLVPTPRPFVVNNLDILPGVGVQKNDSFPSGHAGSAFAIAAAVWDTHHRIGGILLLMALLVAVGRVLLFVHSPLDVIVGGFIGVGVAFLVNRVLFKVKG